MSTSSEDFTPTSEHMLHKPKLKPTVVRTKRLLSVPDATPGIVGHLPSTKDVEKLSAGKQTSRQPAPVSAPLPSKQSSREKFAPQEMTGTVPKHISLDRQSVKNKPNSKAPEKVVSHRPRTSRIKGNTARRKHSEVKEAATFVEGSPLSSNSTSLLETFPATKVLHDTDVAAPTVIGGIAEGKEQREREMPNVQRSATTTSTDAFEIEHPLLRVPTSEDLEQVVTKSEKDRDSARLIPQGTALQSCQEASKVEPRSRPSSGISLDDLRERLQKTPKPGRKSATKAASSVSGTTSPGSLVDKEEAPRRAKRSADGVKAPRRSLARKHTGRRKSSPVVKRSSTSINAPLLAESSVHLPLITYEQFKRAAPGTQARPVVTLTLDDMAESYKGKTWWPCAHPPASTGRSTAHVHVPQKGPTTREKHRAHVLPSVSAGNLEHGDHIVRHGNMSIEEYVLYPLTTFLLVGFVLVVIFIFIPRNNMTKHLGAHKQQLRVTCESPSCFRDTDYLNSLLSWENVNPCQDFYAFVCRQWVGSYVTPSSGSFVSVDDDIAAFLEDRFHVQLKEAPSDANSYLQPVIDLHSKCMDTKRIEDEEWEPLLELMSRVFLDGFPLTPPIRKSLSVWRTAAKILRMTGTAALLGIALSSNDSAVLTDLVSIGLPDAITDNDYVDVNEAVRLYTSAAFAAMSALKKQYVPSSFTLSIIKFATVVENLSDVTPTENASKVDSLQSFPQLVIFLQEIFRDVRPAPYFSEKTAVMMQPVSVVNNIIQLVDSTELSTVMNYLGVRLMIQVSPFIPDSGLAEFYSVLLYGKRRGNLPRGQLCIRAVEKALFPLTNLAVLAGLNANVSIFDLQNLTNGIIAEFLNDIDASPYFTAESRAIIRNVLNTTRLIVARPNWLSNKVAIDTYVQALPVNAVRDRNAIDTYVIYHERTFFTSLALGSTQHWSRSTFSTDCWYEPNPDTIYVPLLVFNISRAKDEGVDAIQLSRAGPRLIRCAFDALIYKTRTSQVHHRWLKGKTEAKLREVESCLGTQEASLITSFQRARDVLAVNSSFARFIKALRMSEHTIALKLPQNRLLTEEQLFFIYLMLQSCEKSGGSENRASNAGRDWTIALRNTETFPAEFLCSPETPMNVQKKCLGV